MIMSSENHKKQKALYHYLSSTLTEQQTLEAMVIWQDKYAIKAGFSVRYFADDISKISGGALAPKELVLNMVKALTQDTGQLSDPTDKIEFYRLQSGRYFASTKSTHIDAFNLLCTKLFTLLAPQVAQAAKTKLLKEYLPTAKVSSALKAHLAKAFQNSPIELKISDASVDDLKIVVNYCYIILCNLLGPNGADAHFSSTLRRLEQNGGAQYSDIFKKLM